MESGVGALPNSEPVSSLVPVPSGTVTFAFTDIEGSTVRWERNPAAMQAAVRRHDELMRAAVAAHGGHVFKTIGDAFCVSFARPQDAVAATLEAQRALAAEDFSAVGGVRVRMALHTGTADERDGDYFGPTVNRVARLLAIGHGGQVLVSGATAGLVLGALPPGTGLLDLGEHRLKDLNRPERVHQLVGPELARDFAALRSLDATPNNLPGVPTSFVGRETEVAAIAALLDESRLVTLVGSGGIGKTRTSLQVAANVLDRWSDGVWFIELAPLSTGEYLPSTVAQTMGLSLGSDGDETDNLTRALKLKRALLVFDNCEHVLDSAARSISAILRACPNVKILASSRQGLGIAGEEAYRLPTLDVPAGDATLLAREAEQCAAVALFVDRARSVDRRFELTDENAPIVADICRRLDGIPLAIELAAVRVKILSPRQLRERLDERFRVLTGGSRDVLPRQQTLRALIDWSYDLLDERERALFRRLGIFVNGFTLEGAVAVGSDDELDELDAFDVVTSLVDKSLVLTERDGDALRYRLLESTRVYAREKLANANDLERCAERHLRYLRDRFAEASERYETTARRAALDEDLATELEDVRAALDFALQSGSAVAGGELLAGTNAEAWEPLGLENECRRRAEAFIARLPDAEPRLLALLSSAVARIAGNAGQWALASETAAGAVAYARRSGDRRALAEALLQVANCAVRRRLFEQADDALAEADANAGASAALRPRLLHSRAALCRLRGDLEAAARAFEELRLMDRALGNAQLEFSSTLDLAECDHERGETERAIDVIREVLPALRTGTDRNLLANVLVNFAGYLVAGDRLDEAPEIAREAIRLIAATEPEFSFIAVAIEHLALALALRGELARAAMLEGYAERALREHGFEREFTETTTNERLRGVLAALEPEELQRRLAAGAALSPESAVALALEEP